VITRARPIASKVSTAALKAFEFSGSSERRVRKRVEIIWYSLVDLEQADAISTFWSLIASKVATNSGPSPPPPAAVTPDWKD